MNPTRLLFGILILFRAAALGQAADTNKTDSKGMKQGYWQQFYSNGKTRYTGYFKNDKPIGKFEYYSDMGDHFCTLDYFGGDSAIGKYYHLNKTLKAEGKYYLKMRTGIWKFYNEYGDITSQEVYINDKRNGPYRIYYHDGRIAKDGYFIQGLEQGYFKEYFPDGKLKFEGNYVDGNPNGKVIYYLPSGKTDCIGFYRDAVRDSTWIYYDKNSSKIARFDYYKNGRLKSSKTPEELKKIKEERSATKKEEE